LRANFAAKKSHTSLRCGPLWTVDAPEGRVASVANKGCLRSTWLRILKDLNPPGFDIWRLDRRVR